MFIFLIPIYFVFACNNSDQSGDKHYKDSIASADSTKTNTEELYIFSNNNVGSLKIGCSKAEIQKYYKDCDFINTEGGYYGLGGGYPTIKVKRGQADLFLYFTNFDSDKATGFLILSPLYHTRTGIRVGMTTGELKKIYPDCKIGINMESLVNEGIYLEKEHLILSFPYNKKTPIGHYSKDSIIDTDKMRLDGKVESILLKPSS